LNHPDKTRVLLLIKSLGLGGAERLIADSMRHMDRDRFEYEVAYFVPWKNQLVPEIEAAGIPVHCLNIGRSYDPRAILRLSGLLRSRSYSVVHSHLPMAGVAARLARFLTRKVDGVVYTEHNVLSAYNPLMHILDRITFRMDDATIAVSERAGAPAQISRDDHERCRNWQR